MNRGIALVGGVGLGAALMYLFDPDRGKDRRTSIRDKVEAAGNKVSDKAEEVGRDIRNRASEIVAETKAIFRPEDVTDEVLSDRVRARLSRLPAQVGALDVDATNGTVILRGKIQAGDLPGVMRAARYVRGVRKLENQLNVQPQTGGVSGLHATPAPFGAH